MPPLRFTVIAALAAIACGSSSASNTSTPATPSAPSPPAPVEATGVVIVANHCRLTKEASREAEQTLSRLVKPCNTVLKERLTFRVVLDPSGSIGFARAGDAGTDEIPLCVVTQKLQHKVRLKAPCVIDVRFEPTSIAPASDAAL